MATTSEATIHQRCSPSVARSQAGLLSAVPKARVRAPAGCSAMMRIVLARPPGTGRTRVHHHLSWLEAGVVGAMQGVAELFPVSSLGHSVLLPAVVGGSWARDLSVSAPESPYLAFIVGLHVATAAALLAYFWRDWLRIIGGLLTSVRDRQVQTPDQRLAWMLILATIPVGISGLALEHLFRTVLGKPVPAAIFLTLNGLILYGGERLRRRAPAGAGVPGAAGAAGPVGHAGQTRTAARQAARADLASDRRLA